MMKMYDLVGKEPDRCFSPYCWRIKMALAHKGLEVELMPWHFTEKDEIAFSGQGQVPVLLDGENVISDSWKIAQYLEIKYNVGPSLQLNSPEILFIKYWTESIVQPQILKMLILDIHDHLHEKDRAYFRESRESRIGMPLEEFCLDRDKQLPEFQKSLLPLRLTVKKQDFLGGASPGFSDYMVFGAFQWARCISPFKLLSEDDPVYDWRNRMLELHDGLGQNMLAYPV